MSDDQTIPDSPGTLPVEASADQTIEAFAGRYYRNARYILTMVLVLFGFWFLRDGFFAWPEQNRQALAAGAEKPPHSDTDLALNKGLGILMPPLALVMLAWTLYSSRGCIRLSQGILQVPGHPDVPISKIESIDKARWERKGIAMLQYRLDDGTQGTVKIDDFVYDQGPTDRIFAIVEKSLVGDA